MSPRPRSIFSIRPFINREAKLLVRYVLDRSAIDSIDGSTSSTASSRSIDTIIGAEVAIITSWDLAVQAAEALGPKRLLPHSSATPTKEAAAGTISQNLTGDYH